MPLLFPGPPFPVFFVFVLFYMVLTDNRSLYGGFRIMSALMFCRQRGPIVLETILRNCNIKITLNYKRAGTLLQLIIKLRKRPSGTW